MNTSTIAPEIIAFARGVREALADLPAEEVDDLTEGLEADLAESLAEDLRRTLPDPVAYAAELRQAAGLPGRAPRRSPLADTWHGVRAGATEVIGRNPALASVAEFLTALRPAWWIVRAWLATWLLAAFFGTENGYLIGGVSWIVLVPFVVVSVQWGRGRWGFPGLRGVVVAGNVFAVLVLLPVMAAAGGSNGPDTVYVDSQSSDTPQGLSMNGQPVENIYAYDAAGNKLTGVQLFDVDGKPLVPDTDVNLTSIQYTPGTLETGQQAYNVYPLALTKVIWDSYGEAVPDPNVDPGKAAAYANGPFLKVPALQAPAAPVEPAAPTSRPGKVAKHND